jgi:hypothetical protein
VVHPATTESGAGQSGCSQGNVGGIGMDIGLGIGMEINLRRWRPAPLDEAKSC